MKNNSNSKNYKPVTDEAEMTLVNTKEMARRISKRIGFTQKDTEEVLNELEDVMIEALEKEELVKFGKSFKLHMVEKKATKTWDGIHRLYKEQPPKAVPKFKALSRVEQLKKGLY